jgi:UDP-glucose:(heptosyl)LPS alpha-1,3-glucosyltransferase
MKLAIVRQKYTPFGGAERFVERALASLVAQGADVSIIARQWPTGLSLKGRRVDPFYLGRTWRDWSFARGVQKIIARGDYDLVQSHERIPGCHIYRAGDGVHATWLALRAAARGSTLSEKLSPWHRYTLAAEAAMFRHPNLAAVICNSRMVRDDIAQRFGVADAKLHVIYNGVDLENFHPRLRDVHRAALRQKVGAGDTAPVALFVGSGYERKGLPALLAAFAHLPEDKSELWVVGYDKQQAAMQRQAARLGIAARVRFFGAQKDVRPFYGAADLFALPTLYDPFPNAALEALACGLPVVTTTSCGAAELITAANGAVVAANDVAALASAISALCLPGRAAAMRDAARSSVSGLDLASMAQRLTALYAQSLGRKPPHTGAAQG